MTRRHDWMPAVVMAAVGVVACIAIAVGWWMAITRMEAGRTHVCNDARRIGVTVLTGVRSNAATIEVLARDVAAARTARREPDAAANARSIAQSVAVTRAQLADAQDRVARLDCTRN